jgi:hypothetical protein
MLADLQGFYMKVILMCSKNGMPYANALTMSGIPAVLCSLGRSWRPRRTCCPPSTPAHCRPCLTASQQSRTGVSEGWVISHA